MCTFIRSHVIVTCMCIFMFCLAVSPVLATLTSSYSSDTIWFLTFVLHLIHFLCHDYSYVNATHHPVPFWGILSFNVGIYASILCASRLSSSIDVFAYMLLAFQCYAGFPILARCCKVSEKETHDTQDDTIIETWLTWRNVNHHGWIHAEAK